jgi:hypothetical protein
MLSDAGKAYNNAMRGRGKWAAADGAQHNTDVDIQLPANFIRLISTEPSVLPPRV